MINVHYVSYSAADLLKPVTWPTVCLSSNAGRGEAQRGLVAVIQMVLNGYQQGSIVSHVTVGNQTVIEFKFRNGNEATLTLLLT